MKNTANNGRGVVYGIDNSHLARCFNLLSTNANREMLAEVPQLINLSKFQTSPNASRSGTAWPSLHEISCPSF